MAHGLTYKDAGVDIDLKERLIPIFKRLARPAAGAHLLGGIGGFGALVGLNGARGMRSPVLVAGTDGVGTKLKIAFATGRHDTIGIDCVAMCVNDIVCHNARPLFFLDYIGCGKLDADVAVAIVKGIARGCAEAGISLVGGETAQMPGIYRPREYDLAGFAVGHSNGFSLARKVLLERGKLKLNARVDELGCTLADEMLRPTRIYVKTALELFRRFKIKGLANITGGGMPENLPRVMPSGLRAEIHRASWPVPPIFEMIAKLGRITQAEMDRTFNNGLGMVAIVAASQAGEVIGYLRRRRQSAYVVGEVKRGGVGVRFL